MTSRARQARPPHPDIELIVGVTGHRHLDEAHVAAVRAALDALLVRLTGEVARIVNTTPMLADADVDRPTGNRIIVLSQLAKGADQIAAGAALAAGCAIRAVLPSARDDFIAELHGDDRVRFAELLAQTDGCWNLPSSGHEPDHGYLLAGEAMIAESDLVVAIWDGGEANGPGGTGDVVDAAVRRGVPVIHLPVDQPERPLLLWPGPEGVTPVLLRRQTVPRRPLDDARLSGMIDDLLAMPSVPSEQGALVRFLGEREQRWNTRLEYPLLLALAGIRGLRRRQIHAAPYEAAAAADWQGFRDGTVTAPPGMARLERAFAWADGLANHYAQLYRSGTVFNYVAAALSVLLVLVGLLIPEFKLGLISAELLAVVTLIINTRIGNTRNWHQRWLDYRYLAETLRPMRSLKLAGVAGRQNAGTPLRANRRWVDWYAATLWRSLGHPPSLADAAAVRAAAAHIAAHDVHPQIAYHHVNAHRMHQLDHRLHRCGTVLFVVTGALSLGSLASFALGLHHLLDGSKWMTVLSAGLPMIGATMFSIRGALDLTGAAARSEQTAEALVPPASRLATQSENLVLVAQAIDEAAQVMLDELADWRVSYRERKLAIPS